MNKIQIVIVCGYVLWAITFILWLISMKKKEWEKGMLYSIAMIVTSAFCTIIYFIGKGI